MVKYENVTVNVDEFVKKYVEIRKVCFDNVELMPVKFNLIPIPRKYEFKKQDVEDLDLDMEINDKLMKLEEKRLTQIKKILDDDDIKRFDKLEEFYNDELKAFIKKHKEYKSLVNIETFNMWPLDKNVW